MCLWVFCEQKNMLYLWYKLVRGKYSLSSLSCVQLSQLIKRKLFFCCQRKQISVETWMKQASIWF